jgi:PAS domain S-box-containing protein
MHPSVTPPADALFSALVNASADAIISTDTNGTVTSWNRAAQSIFGYSPSEMIGQSVLLLIPAELAHEEGSILGRVRRGESVEHYETTRRRKDGTHLDISLTVSPIFDAAGKIIGASKIARDVTAQKRELEKFRVTLASIGDAVISTDKEGRVAFMNVVAEQLTGWKEAEALGRPIEEVFRIISENTRQPVDSPVAKVLKDGCIIGLANHTVLIDRQQRECPIDDSAAPIRDARGQLVGVVLVFRDYSARRAAEIAALRLAAIVEGSDDAIVAKDLNGIVTSWNPAAERIFGFTASEMIGQPITRVIPPERLNEEPQILARLQRGERVEHFQTVRQRKDGRLLHVSLTISPICDKDGLVIGASKIARDITELKAAQERLESYALELEAKVRERTSKLGETVQELEAFSYGLSHDMRAPLRAIRSFCEIVLEDHGAKIPEAVEYLQKAISSAKRLDRLIQDILELTSLSQAEIIVGPVSLDDLVRDLLGERPESERATMSIEARHPLAPVIGHPALLTQCLSNLLENAIKFVAAGARPLIKIYTETSGNRVRICLTDNGIGINEEDKAKLFTMFQRLESAQGYRGTGIGLAIVRRAAQRMNGTVGVQSTPGVGSTFWVELSKA